MKMANTVASYREETLACNSVKEFVGVFYGVPADTITTANAIKNQGNFIPFLGSLIPSIGF